MSERSRRVGCESPGRLSDMSEHPCLADLTAGPPAVRAERSYANGGSMVRIHSGIVSVLCAQPPTLYAAWVNPGEPRIAEGNARCHDREVKEAQPLPRPNRPGARPRRSSCPPSCWGRSG